MRSEELIRFDWAVKRILRNKANFEVLESLLSILIGNNIKITGIAESESNQHTARDKYNRVDVKARLESGEHVIIEVQNLYQMDFMERILFGVSKGVTEQIEIGDQYSKIKKVYSVAIVYFKIGDGSDYIYKGVTDFKGLHNGKPMRLNRDERLAIKSLTSVDDLFPEYYLLCVDDFDKHAVTPLDEWMQYLKTGRINADTKVQGLKKALEILSFDQMSADDKDDYRNYIDAIRAQRDSIERAQHEGLEKGRAEGLEKGRAEGRAEGVAEGRAAREREIAKAMKDAGMPASAIAQATGMPEADIEAL